MIHAKHNFLLFFFTSKVEISRDFRCAYLSEEKKLDSCLNLLLLFPDMLFPIDCCLLLSHIFADFLSIQSENKRCC